ncbi:hypothetical protein ACO0LB_19650 [Undibacterium sp. SXout7W]|uniref:hypothetical protein n=1 Tax=Undibacterium sp. SXout7W TaxID=3413049 RepID=UPI003BF2C77A
MQITSEFGKLAPKFVANYADNKASTLNTLAESESDPQKKAELEAQAKQWGEGGIYRIALHTATGAAIGGISGAAGAATSASSAEFMNELQSGIQTNLQKAGLNEETATLTAKGIADLTAAGMGLLVGGTQGAASALATDANNRQLHPNEIQWIKDSAKRYAQQQGISQSEAEKNLAQQAYRQTQDGAAGAWDQSASDFLKQARGMLAADGNSGPGYMFQATAAQKADTNMYANLLPETSSFYAKNGIQIPTAQQVTTATHRSDNTRDTVSILTKLGAAGSGAVALAGLSPTLLTWALANPVEATNIGLITAETAAAIKSGAIMPDSLVPMLSGGVKVVSSLEQAVSGVVAKATTGGFINATKVCESACAIGGLSQEEQGLVNLIKNRQDAQGNLTETLLTQIAQRTGMDVLSGGKYGANNGFDVVLKAKDGTVTIILDGKQFTASGAVKLSSKGAGDTNQLSADWVTAVIDNIKKLNPQGENSPAVVAIKAAERNGTLNIAVGGVNRTTGQVLVIPVTVPNKLPTR